MRYTVGLQSGLVEEGMQRAIAHCDAGTVPHRPARDCSRKALSNWLEKIRRLSCDGPLSAFWATQGGDKSGTGARNRVGTRLPLVSSAARLK